jgi:hypothetical protein
MSDEVARRVDYLAQHGAALIDNGYNVIPIQVGKKAPGFDGWQKARSTKPQLQEWLENGHRWSGAGITTRHTPAIDIDVLDETIADKIEEWIRFNIGDAPVRIGRAPKRLMVFRTDEPFRKMRSTVYTDEWGDKQLIEVLGDGQQFVAYHTHPDTGRAYEWPHGDNPLNTQANELTTVTVEQIELLLAYFDELAEKEGWVVQKAARQQAKQLDTDNPFLEDSAPVDISEDELRARLLLVPNPDDYDTWLQIGMALYHQFDGEETGQKFWHEWAETADNYDADALDRRWNGFKVEGKRKAPITARYILRLSKEAVENTTQELTVKLCDAFMGAKNLREWEKARKQAQEAEIDVLARAAVAQIAKSRREAITGTKIPLVDIKKAIAYSPKKNEKTPQWCRPWIYDTSDDKFFNTTSKIAASQQGFNAMYDRESLTKKDIIDGKTAPSSKAHELALNLFKISVVAGRRYEPGRDAIYHTAEGTFANTYPEHEIPEVPEKLLPRDKRNIERVKNHLAHLIGDEGERRMFLDWISWVVQNPGQHANYAIVMQGVQGDGKTFFAEMLRAIMGTTNVRMVNAKILESDFSDWVIGQCLACIEEVRLIKHDRYEVINSIKPFITNNTIEVHPKGKASYNARNTTSYLLFTNYKDALPIDDDSRRYLVLFSRWQRKDLLDTFKDENPDYYELLYRTFEESAGALRQWLLKHEQSSEFNPRGDAPVTSARNFMVRQAKPEFVQQLDDLIGENVAPEISYELLDLGVLSDQMVGRGIDFPAPKTMSSMLQRHGWEVLGRIRVQGDWRRFWSRRIEQFQSDEGHGLFVDSEKVRSFLKRRMREFEDNEL